MTIRVTVDKSGAAYFHFGEAKLPHKKTKVFYSRTMLDIDRNGQAIGLELLFENKEVLAALVSIAKDVK